MKAVGNRIRELRQQRCGESLETFAAGCGLETALLERIEAGTVDINISMIVALAGGLQIEVATMLEGIV